MFQVMIVDDETIILSGIKFLIDWEQEECTIIYTAKNGSDALEKIRSCQPDIVLCDIKMPVMDGIELLKAVSKEFPSIVFIMLTNFQEFDLARETLRLRAADYLLKAQLEPASLIKSLNMAKEECRKRSQLKKADTLSNYYDLKQKEIVENALLKILFESEDSSFMESAKVLKDNHMLTGYSLYYIPLDLSGMPEGSFSSLSDKKKIHGWVKELTEQICEQIFAHYRFINTGQADCLILYLWGFNRDWEEAFLLFQNKLSATVSKIVQARCIAYSTRVYFGESQLIACREELMYLIETYYLGKELEPDNSARPVFEPLGLLGIGDRLMAELNAKNIAGVLLLLDKASERIQNVAHQKSQAVWLCSELYRSLAKSLNMNSSAAEDYQEINSLMTRKQVLLWIDKLKNSIREMLYQNPGMKSQPVERAKQYIKEHIDEHINLQEVAEYVAISPAYFSSLFKKQSGQSFVDYVNKAKVERACSLIKEGNYRINEIAYKLSFENAYYFTRVFRRFTGTTPREYQREVCDKK